MLIRKIIAYADNKMQKMNKCRIIHKSVKRFENLQ
jgi:hypothetical protein